MIPEPLVAALLSQHSGHPGGVRLVVGRAPNDWPAEIIPPPPAVLLGGTIAGTSRQAVFHYPAGTDDALLSCEALAIEHGFQHPTHAFGDGFKNADVVMLCGGADLLQLRRHFLPGDEPVIVASLSLNSSMCNGEFAQRTRGHRHSEVEMPLMNLPPGVKFSGGGGSSGGGDHNTRHIRLTTSMSCDDIVAWYAPQLEAAGWRLGAVLRDADAVTRRVETTDKRGGTWRGLLTVYENGPVREVYLYTALAP